MPIALGLLALLGVVFAVAAGGKSTAVDTTGMPANLVTLVNASVESADPTIMRATAAKIRAAGFPAAANSLEAAALIVQKAIDATPATRATVNPAPKADDPDARALAGRLAQLLSGLSLSDARNSQDVKNLVLAYEAQEKRRGFYVGNLDGIFGPKAALTLAQDHGIVPPHPLYWPKKDPAGAKRTYKASLATFVASDPQRAEEWTQAMGVDND
jgi:hypothetical protein